MKHQQIIDFLSSKEKRIPLLPLRDIVLFPHSVIALFVGREQSLNAIEESSQHFGSLIVTVTQKELNTETPNADDLHHIGTISKIVQHLTMPDGTQKILVESFFRVKVSAFQEDRFMTCEMEIIQEKEDQSAPTSKAVARIAQRVEKLAQENDAFLLKNLKAAVNRSNLRGINMICANIPLSLDKKLQLLETLSIKSQLTMIDDALTDFEQQIALDKRVNRRLKRRIEKSQKDYYLSEKLKAIRQEMGEEEGADEVEEFKRRIARVNLPKHALEKAHKELKKFKTTPSQSPESMVVRNYLDTLLSLPWHKESSINNNLKKAQTMLDRAHYGLEEVKLRIIEHLAVRKRVGKLSGTIICLVGPPGVGKTSMAASIAEATGRKYVRIALGGMRDEAEIRGHRRTYIGSMPGRILQKMASCKVRNPLFLLDEIDKIGSDFRGDPASALLEVLDPEQNIHFTDHFLEIEFDLSNVMFIATSNTLNISPPLLDRMETIELSGYTDNEKIEIAKKHLIPGQFKKHNLSRKEMSISITAVRSIIHRYTREPGVRSLEREIAKLCRKSVTSIQLQKATPPVRVNASNLSTWLGVERFKYEHAESDARVGEISGLAWTAAGGDLLTIEAVHYAGKGRLLHTGKLGDVMKESMEAALSVVKSLTPHTLNIDGGVFSTSDFHVHVPEGATPKDGPSAGLAVVLVLASSLEGVPIRAEIAVTGEITLHGEVLAIGGLKQKLLAASRSGIKKVLIPQENERHLADIPDDIKDKLEIIPIRWVGEALAHVFTIAPPPTARKLPKSARLSAH